MYNHQMRLSERLIPGLISLLLMFACVPVSQMPTEVPPALPPSATAAPVESAVPTPRFIAKPNDLLLIEFFAVT